MRKLILLFSVSLCLFQSSLASRLPRASETDSASNLTPEEQQIANVLGISTELFAKVRDTTFNTSRDVASDNQQEQAVKICRLLMPDNNFPVVSLTKREQRHLNYVLRTSNEAPPAERPIFWNNFVCCEIKNRTNYEAKALVTGMALIYYTHRNGEPERVSGSRNVCAFLNSFERVARDDRHHPELSDEQYRKHEELSNEAKLAKESTRSAAFAKLCEYLNETISPIEQAEALGISVDLYNRFVKLRYENFAAGIEPDRVDIARQICKEIDESEGKPTSEVTGHLQLTNEQNQQFIQLWNIIRGGSNAEKVPTYRNICAVLKDAPLAANTP